MNWRELITAMLKATKASKYSVGVRLKKSSNYLTQLEKRKEDIKVGSLLDVCEVLGYEVVVRRRNYLKAMEGEMILERDKSSI